MMKKRLFAAIAMAIVTGMTSLHAATVPLSEDFDDDFDEIGSGQPDQQGEEWILYTDGLAATWSLENDTTTSGTTDYQVAFSKSGSGFEQGSGDRYLTYSNPEMLSTFSAEFEADAVSGSGGFVIVGFGLFADYDSGDAGSTGYAVDFFLYDNPVDGDRTGQVRIISANGTFSGGALSSGDPLSIDSTGATTYTITADVSINGDTLDLVATVSDGTDSVSTTATDTGRITTGDFSIRTRYGSSTAGSLNVDFDNVFLGIPEPASLVLLLLGGTALVARRRTK
jgi:hypothetical protein